MDDAFMWGFATGALIFSWLAMWQHGVYQRILANKAKGEHRTAEKLDGRFYYIVPESEYNKMDRTMAWYRNAGAFEQCDAAKSEESK